MPFGDFIIKFDESQNLVSEVPVRMRTQMSVLLEKRFRGETLGDRIGRWNYRTNNYVEPKVDVQPFNIYTRNIVKPKVRANAAVMSQAPIAPTCDPRMQQSTRSKKNALISQHVADWTDDMLWTNDISLQINEMKQLTHGVFVRSFWNENKEGCYYKEDEWNDEDFDTPAEVTCVKCGEKSYLDGLQNDVDEETEQDNVISPPACKECGGATEITTPYQNTKIPVATETIKQRSGDNDLEVLPSMEFRVDEKRSKGGKLSKCGWVNRWHLMSQFEIEQEFGTADLGDPEDWPYPLKWLYTLETGTAYPFKSTRQSETLIKQLALYPVRRYYFTPEWLASYTAGENYNFKDQFTIKEGQSARDVVLEMAEAEASERQSAVQKKGLCVALTGRKILGFYLSDFRTELKYTYFVSDPYSFWGLCYSELETSQHLVNQTLTAIGNQVQSNQHIGVFNRDSYDDDDLSGDKNKIFTRMGNDMPIRDTFDVIQALPVTADTWNLYQAMVEEGNETSMVSKEMQGQPSQTKTLGQAQLNRDVSVGVLTPAQQSTAETKVGVIKDQCRIAQMHWSHERLAELCNTADGIISDEDIDTWFKSDLEADVVFSYRAGSEMPKSFTERRDDIAYVSSYIATWAELVPGLATPELAMDMINRMSDLSTIDGLDLRNAETDKEVAEVRFTIIASSLDMAMAEQLGIAQDPQQLQAAVLAQTLQNPILMPLKQENHVVEMEFYRDKCLAEYRKENPNLLLVAALQEMIGRHNQAMIAMGQEMTSTEMAIQAPAIEAQAVDPMASVVESIDYRDLPPEGQAQVAAKAGIQLDPNNIPPSSEQQKSDMVQSQLQLKAHDISTKRETEQQKLAMEQERADSDAEDAMTHKILDHQAAERERQHNAMMVERQHEQALELQKNAPKPSGQP